MQMIRIGSHRPSPSRGIHISAPPEPIWPVSRPARPTSAYTPPVQGSDFQFLHPAPLRPTNVLENLDIGHRDRSKKYICPYLLTDPRPGPIKFCEKSSKIMKIITFCRFFEAFAPRPLPQRHRTITNMQNRHF